jgi:hypothetical protein
MTRVRRVAFMRDDRCKSVHDARESAQPGSFGLDPKCPKDLPHNSYIPVWLAPLSTLPSAPPCALIRSLTCCLSLSRIVSSGTSSVSTCMSVAVAASSVLSVPDSVVVGVVELDPGPGARPRLILFLRFLRCLARSILALSMFFNARLTGRNCSRSSSVSCRAERVGSKNRRRREYGRCGELTSRLSAHQLGNVEFHGKLDFTHDFGLFLDVGSPVEPDHVYEMIVESFNASPKGGFSSSHRALTDGQVGGESSDTRGSVGKRREWSASRRLDERRSAKSRPTGCKPPSSRARARSFRSFGQSSGDERRQRCIKRHIRALPRQRP